MQNHGQMLTIDLVIYHEIGEAQKIAVRPAAQSHMQIKALSR